MTLRHLVIREIIHRRFNSALSAAAVAVAAGCLVAALTLLRATDIRTEHLIAGKEKALEVQMKEMENSYRKITKRMGFNVLILPKEQNLGDFYAENYASKYMPEEYAERLANAKDIVTVRHLLPMLQQKIEWPERKRKILLIGVRGEMPWTHRSNAKPILEAVPKGTAVVGYELQKGMALAEGDTITLMGRSLKIGKLHPERGSIDDITIWIDLGEAQELLGLKGKINAMMALDCKCAWADLPKIRREIQRILPETQVIEIAGKALARAETRNEAERTARVLLEREKRGRQELKIQRERLAAVLVPLVVAACAVWVAVLAFLNVRDRREEIGILRTLGLRTGNILGVFLSRAAFLGLTGSVAGVAAGSVVGAAAGDLPAGMPATGALPGIAIYAAVLVAAPVVAVLAGWIPSLVAAGQDPAVVLREE